MDMPSLAEADNARRVFAYLCKTRGLDYDLVASLVRQGVIAQEEKTGNVLFKYYDEQGKVIGAEKVGTSTEHKFKGIATGSAAGHGFEVVRGTGEKAFFFESAIDMLSYLQMHDKELTDCRLVSMMGVKPNIVLDTMLRHNISPENVFLCSDNDTAGNEFAQRLQEQYPDMKRVITPDTYKDWNDMLRGIPKAVEHETEKKEVDSVADLITFGNRMWNDATDNRDKSLISMQLADFQRVRDTLERSGIKRYDEAQFGEMLSLVNAYIAQAPAERYGENSKLTDMLEAKSSFDRSIELSDFFSLHDFSDEQRAAITAMFVGDVTRGQIDSIDETFTAEDIQAYDEILHNALQESDIEDFLAEHAHSVQKQSDRDQALADAFASHKDMQLSGSGDDLTNFRLHYDTEINNGEGGYNLIADRIAVPLIKDMSISVLSDDISFDTFKDFLSSHDLAFESVIDTIKPEKQATEEEVLFSNADLARFLAEHTLSSDEWEDMASPLFERGYLEKHQPSDKASFGYHLPEKELYALAERYHHGDDIRRELALGLMIHASDNIADKDKVEFVFEDGKISDRTFYYGENLRHTMDLSYGDDGITCSFSGMERFVSFEEIGQAFIDRIHEEYEDLAYWAVLDYIKDDIPDISDDTVKELITAFDGAALHGWENGDNNPKLNRIKKALFEVLGNEDQTEKAFACIAKHKYNVTFEAEKPEKQPDSLTFHFGKDKGDEWVSESDIVHDFALTHPDCSFALGNAVLEYLDEKQHSERNIPELKAGWYKKTDFSISAVIGGEEFNYDGRFDIGDGKGTGGGSLIDHIRTYNEGFLGYTQHPFNQPEYKERAQRMLDIFVPFLEAHSELTAEEQRIFDDFKAQHPIRTYDDVEKAQGTFKIYQLPSGEKYHGVRFEDMEQLKRDGVQLNHDDYELVYEGEVGEFRGNATLEALYTQFNTDHPEEFRGHSLSVSDVKV